MRTFTWDGLRVKLHDFMKPVWKRHCFDKGGTLATNICQGNVWEMRDSHNAPAWILWGKPFSEQFDMNMFNGHWHGLGMWFLEKFLRNGHRFDGGWSSKRHNYYSQRGRVGFGEKDHDSPVLVAGWDSNVPWSRLHGRCCATCWLGGWDGDVDWNCLHVRCYATCWVGVGGGDDNITWTCCHVWCYATCWVGAVGDRVLTFLEVAHVVAL